MLEGLVVAIEKSLDLTAHHAARLYRNLGEICMAISRDPRDTNSCPNTLSVRAWLLLKDMTASRLLAYEAFATEFLTLSELSKAPLAPEWLNKLADEVNYKLLAKVLATNLMPQILAQQNKFSNPRSRANLLASLIYFYRLYLGRRFQKSFTDEDYMMVVSDVAQSRSQQTRGPKKSNSDYDEEQKFLYFRRG